MLWREFVEIALSEVRGGVRVRIRIKAMLFQAKDAIELLDDAVTFAGGSFKSLTVQNHEDAATILDNFARLQSLGGKTDAGAIRA